MALETVVYQQELFSGGSTWSFKEEEEEEYHYENNWINSSSLIFSPPHNSLLVSHYDELFNQTNSTHQDNGLVLPTTLGCDYNVNNLGEMLETRASVDVGVGGGKRRRGRSRKNMEERENQRMTHIAVERNRRKQMNLYLCELRSLMPDSYVPRADQASIVGGAINYVKELEQRLQLLSTTQKGNNKNKNPNVTDPISSPFSEFITFPQYSMMANSTLLSDQKMRENCMPSLADIEVTMVESNASLKIRSRRRTKQLLKIVSGLQFMRLSILHLNVTTKEQFVFYSISVKVEDDCKLATVDEIATAVHRMISKIEEESLLR